MIISAAQFDFEKIETVIGDDSVLDCDYVSSQLLKAANAAKEDKSKDEGVFRLLYQIASVHDKFDNSAEPYSPMLITQGRRSMIPEDLKGEQTAELVEIANQIKNDCLRARVADITWINDRKQHLMAKLAIDAYCTQIERYLKGDAKFPHDLDSLIDHRAFELITRALTISRTIKGNKKYPKQLISLIDSAYEKSLGNLDVPSMTRLLRLFLKFEINNTQEIAETVFQMFESRQKPDSHWDKNFLIELECLFRRNNLTDKSTDCLILIAECSVKRAEEMNASSMASAHCLMTAIEELKLARGSKARDRYRELRKLLREKQEESVFELQSFSHSIDIKDLVENNIKRQKELTLGQALGEFASLSVSSDPLELQRNALESIQEHPIASIFESSKLDREGKVVARTESATFSSSVEEDVILTEVADELKSKRNVVVASGIEPIRRHIQTEMNLSDKALFIICENSPFIPPFHQSIFLLGFSKFFLGDMISAGSILLPQFENSLRYILKTSGTDTSTIESDSTQVDRSISQLLNRFRKPLVDLLGEAIVFEIDYLFNSRKGPALRHEIAHGKLQSGLFYSSDVIYGCWFVFRITCMPLFTNWKLLSDRIDELSPVN